MIKRLAIAVFLLVPTAGIRAGEEGNWIPDASVKKVLDFVLHRDAGGTHSVCAITHDRNIYKYEFDAATPAWALMCSGPPAHAGGTPPIGQYTRHLSSAVITGKTLPLLISFRNQLYFVAGYETDYRYADTITYNFGELVVCRTDGTTTQEVLVIRDQMQADKRWLDPTNHPSRHALRDGYLFKNTDFDGPTGTTIYYGGGGGTMIGGLPLGAGGAWDNPNHWGMTSSDFLYESATGSPNGWNLKGRSYADQYGYDPAAKKEFFERKAVGYGSGGRVDFHVPGMIIGDPMVNTGTDATSAPPNGIKIWVNGVEQTPGTHYVANSNGCIRLFIPPSSQYHKVEAQYWRTWSKIGRAMPNGYRYSHLIDVDFGGTTHFYDYYGRYNSASPFDFSEGELTGVRAGQTVPIHTEPWAMFQMAAGKVNGTNTLFRAGHSPKGDENFLWAKTAVAPAGNWITNPGHLGGFDGAPNTGSVSAPGAGVYWRSCCLLKNKVTDEDVATGDGILTAFELDKDEGIDLSTLEVSVGGAVQNTPADYVCTVTGDLTFTVAPGNGLAIVASYEYTSPHDGVYATYSKGTDKGSWESGVYRFADINLDGGWGWDWVVRSQYVDPDQTTGATVFTGGIIANPDDGIYVGTINGVYRRGVCSNNRDATKDDPAPTTN